MPAYRKIKSHFVVRCLIALLLCVFYTAEAKSQLNIRVGEHFMDGTAIKKLHVCVEDHSVWLLAAGGKVYVKKATDADFTLYPATIGLDITGVTGFNAERCTLYQVH